MRTRATGVRSTIAALLVSLVGLWVFAAYVIVQDSLNLLWIHTLDQDIGGPTDALVTTLQTERRLSTQYLGGAGEQPHLQLDEARAATDQARAALRKSATASSVRWAANDAFQQRVSALLDSSNGLERHRGLVDTGRAADRSTAAGGYTAIIDTAFALYEELAQRSTGITEGAGAVVSLSRATEMLAQEDAMLTGILQAQQFTGAEPVAFTSIVGVQRAFFTEARARLSSSDRAGYDAVVAGTAFQHLRDLEDQAIQHGRAGAAVSFTLVEWRAAVDPVLTQLRRVELDLADVVRDRATPAAAGILLGLALIGGLGLVAVIGSIFVSVSTTRHFVRQLERLRTSAEELAGVRLPRVVQRLQQGERVDVAAEAPALEFGHDEIGRLGHAFNAVQETAINTAVEQAELRRGVRDVFLSLARRSQTLLHRQLGLLDAMERRAADADELAELFRVDHLATRMRRNAENLIVLSGASAGRAWRRPIPVIDLIRGALAEIEDYTRVTVVPIGNASLIGRAVGDVIHLLAELIENAVSFSPPQTVVRVSGSIVGNGYAIEVEDRGLGMGLDELAAANAQLVNPPEFKLSSTARLGLYVVAKLAERHGIKVQLSESSYGGTTAVVLLPATLIVEEAADVATSSEGFDAGDLDGLRPSQLAAIGTGRQAPASPADAPAIPPPRPASTPAPAPTSPQTGAGRVTARPRGEPPVLTPAGLPWRPRPGNPSDRPTSIAGSPAPVESALAATGESSPTAPRREPVRDKLASLRAGTVRGRDDAARLQQPELEAPDSTPEDDNGRTDA